MGQRIGVRSDQEKANIEMIVSREAAALWKLVYVNVERPWC